MPQEASTREYDIVIIGGGPGGLAAGLYAARGMHSTLLLEKGVIGGQISLTEIVENYPGVPTVNGFDLARTMLKQAEAYGMAAEDTSVLGLERAGQRWLGRREAGEMLGRAVMG